MEVGCQGEVAEVVVYLLVLVGSELGSVPNGNARSEVDMQGVERLFMEWAWCNAWLALGA